jgi:type IV pilus assembly protein PilB
LEGQLNNQQFIKTLSEKLNLKPKEVQNILRYFNSIVANNLKTGDKINLSGFGALNKIKLNERTVRSLRDSSKTITIPSQNTIRFRPSTEFRKTAQNTIFLNGAKTSNIATTSEENMPKNKISEPVYVAYIDLSQKKIPKEILEYIPEQMARKLQIVPVEVIGNKLVLAMIDPGDQEAIEFVKKKTGLLVEPRICTISDLNNALGQYSIIPAEMAEITKEEVPESKKEKKGQALKSEEIAEGSPASKIVSSLIKKAVRERASDIHIEPNETDVVVRFRIDGVLKKIVTFPKDVQNAVISRIKILSDLKIDETRLPQDGRFRMIIDQAEVDFRVSVLPNVNGEKIVLRILDKSKGLLTIEDLGLRGNAYNILQDNIKKAHGMILVTGPTGSGKTTSLYAMIQKIANEGINIVTLEDPVEYRMKGINQSQVRADIEFTFANGLRSIVRQDPDVIMIGEIRDYETADMAIHAALTGHVVLSTLHTNNAAGAIPRLIDMHIEPFLISSTTNIIIAQRLARKICDKCKTEENLPSEEIEYIKKIMTGTKIEKAKWQFYKGKGCDICNGTGYKGRIGLFEVLPVTNKIKSIISTKTSSDIIQNEAVKEGMLTLKQDGILKALDGLTSIEEVWRVTKD